MQTGTQTADNKVQTRNKLISLHTVTMKFCSWIPDRTHGKSPFLNFRDFAVLENFDVFFINLFLFVSLPEFARAKREFLAGIELSKCHQSILIFVKAEQLNPQPHIG